ncbi:MAG: alkaline phosphatase, partial [Azonexus sp.]|nr:alkaline phosphatase [Azonexus sp.]
PGKTVAEGGANPYRYGHMVEVTVAAEGSTRVAKHYSMGRLSFELGDVMADRRTVYFGDDGTDVIRAMYVADKEGDLSAGTLYAARWLQESGAGFGQARLQWIRLGHASDAEIEALIEGGIRFSDIWEVADAAAVAANPGQYVGFKPLFVYGGTGSRAGVRYYRLKPGQAQAAAFLETRRYAAWLGATSEFTKMEGIAHSRAEGKQWTVMSYVRDGMLAGNNGARPADDIRLEGAAADLNCGAVYESQLRGGQRDAVGQPILSDLVAVDMRAVVSGARQPAGAKSGPFDTCDTEKPANPDNIRYSEAMRTLFIGEDSSNHLNNFVWAYSLDSKQATRIFSAPAGGENTGLNVYDNLNGHAYILGNVQHPGAIEDLQHYPPAIREDLRGKVDPRGMVGYLLGLPALQR